MLPSTWSMNSSHITQVLRLVTKDTRLSSCRTAVLDTTIQETVTMTTSRWTTSMWLMITMVTRKLDKRWCIPVTIVTKLSYPHRLPVTRVTLNTHTGITKLTDEYVYYSLIFQTFELMHL